MAHFAKIDKNNIVQAVHVVNNAVLLNEDGLEEENLGIVFLNNLFPELSGAAAEFTWVQTSFNASFRKRYAAIGYTYDKANDVFIGPSPYPSWTLNGSFDWVCPIEKPDDGKWYNWNETAYQADNSDGWEVVPFPEGWVDPHS